MSNDLRELIEQWREEADEYFEDGHHEAYNVSQRRADQLEQVLDGKGPESDIEERLDRKRVDENE